MQTIKSLSKKELISKKVELMKQKLELLFLKKTQELKSTHKLRDVRRTIARLNTAIGSK